MCRDLAKFVSPAVVVEGQLMIDVGDRSVDRVVLLENIKEVGAAAVLGAQLCECSTVFKVEEKLETVLDPPRVVGRVIFGFVHSLLCKLVSFTHATLHES